MSDGALLTPAGIIRWYCEQEAGAWAATAVTDQGEVLGRATAGTEAEARKALAESVLAKTMAPPIAYAAAGVPLPPRLIPDLGEIAEPIRMAMELVSAAYIQAASAAHGVPAGALPSEAIAAYADAMRALERLRSAGEVPLSCGVKQSENNRKNSLANDPRGDIIEA